MKTEIRNRLSEVRQVRGVAAADLARRVGVSRQTVYAIENGSYMPNTAVALRLAQELEVSVEELFSLEGAPRGASPGSRAEILSAAPPVRGQAVRVCRVGDTLVSVPVSAAPYLLPEADGVVSGAIRSNRAEVAVVPGTEDIDKRLAIAGCDPAIGLLCPMLERASGIEVVAAAASSRLALRWLLEGKVHVAGMHLKDAATGEFNVPILRREYPKEEFAVFTFARWEEGFVTARGNPKGIRRAVDLARRGVRIVNRENGAGSRALLDELLAAGGIAAAKIRGYDRIAQGHLSAAYAVSADHADCCIATSSAAQAFALDFVPLQSERYDLVMRRNSLDLPAVRGLLEVLQKASLRRKLETLAGCDTARTGAAAC